MKRVKLLLLLGFICGLVVDGQELAETKAVEQHEADNQIWKWANFVLLGIGLGYLMGKTLPPFFKSRSSEIQTGISQAQKVKAEAERRAAEMEARLNALGSEIEQFRKQAHSEMEQEGSRIRQETARQMEKLQRQAELEIESAGKLARRDLKKYAGQLALELAEQRIRARMDAATESGLVDDFVTDLRTRGAQN
jgi:F-type H+-transporting ATPase subunit b